MGRQKNRQLPADGRAIHTTAFRLTAAKQANPTPSVWSVSRSSTTSTSRPCPPPGEQDAARFDA